MSYPTQQQILRADPVLTWLDEHFLRRDPYIFKDANFSEIIRMISVDLDVEANGIYCIGSGAVGLSLNPNKLSGSHLKPFDAESDLDLALISHFYFEVAWRDLRQAAQPTLDIDPDLGDLLAWQRKRLFDGAIIATKVLPFLSFGNRWITSLTRLQEKVALSLAREVTINIWIFRDYWSLRNYVSSSLIRCREEMRVK